MWSSRLRISRRGVDVLLGLAVVMGGCGDDADSGPTAGEVSASDDGRIDAVVVDVMPLRDGFSWWLLVDIADGATIDGSSRLAVEAEIVVWGCRGKNWELMAGQLAQGRRFSSEPDDTEARLPQSAAHRIDRVINGVDDELEFQIYDLTIATQ